MDQVEQWRYTSSRSPKENTVLVGVRPPDEAGSLQGGQLQKRELSRVLNLEKENCEHIKWIDLQQVQHCTDLPL